MVNVESRRVANPASDHDGASAADLDAEFKPLVRHGVVRDFVDLRDQIYQPTLGRLQGRQDLPDTLLSQKIGTTHDGGSQGLGNVDIDALPIRRLAFSARHQGQNGRCTGYALAALIDIQRRLQDPAGLTESGREHEQVSADMLYFMARFHDEFERRSGPAVSSNGGGAKSGSEGVRTLRSVIKGLYHHGVCLDLVPGECPDNPAERWQSSCHIQDVSTVLRDLDPYPTVEQAKAARMITLGAYYRLRPVLNDYHAALNETGTILVSAHLHQGWSRGDLDRTGGEIDWSETKAPAGAHAFVIVGYNEKGFLILNSWGEEWGRYAGVGGLALWPYADWARNIIDGWVLRLGVSAPGAFDVSIGEQGGSKVFGRIRAGSTPYLELMGHFAHLDDGHYVGRGAYPFTRGIMDATFSYLDEQLAESDGLGEVLKTPALASKNDGSDALSKADGRDPYKGIVLWMPASLEGMKQTYEQAVQHKKILKDFGLYPYNIFWCSDFVEDAMSTLSDVFAKCAKQAGGDAEHLDQLIEKSVRGVGRAFWRDVKLSASRAVLGPDLENLGALPDGFGADDLGPVARIFRRCLDLGYRHGAQVHIVTEGAGALLLDEVLRIFSDPAIHQRSPQIAEAWKRGRSSLRTINIALPTITAERATPYLLRLVAEMNGRFPELTERARRGSLARIDGPQDFSETDTRLAASPQESKGEGALRAPARIYVPSKKLEERLKVAQYGRSISHLIANAFEDRVPGTGSNGIKTILGQSDVAEKIAPIGADDRENVRAAITQIATQCVEGGGKAEQVRLAREPRLRAEIYKTVKQHSDLVGSSGGERQSFRF